MSLKFRRFLYIFFIIAFLIITPIVSLYAAGYKFSEGLSIEKTGMLIIDTKPRGAKIFLNGIEQKNFFIRFIDGGKSSVTTPTKISNLLPGKYNIKIEMNDYWPWEKELSIESGRSTYIEDIYLFKKDLPFLLSSGIYSDISLSPNKENFSALNEKTIDLINIQSGHKISYRASSTADTAFFEWSYDGNKVIVNDLLFDLSNWENPQDLSETFTGSINNIKFDSYDNNLIYIENNNILYQYNLLAKIKKQILISDTINTFIPKGNHLFIINDLNSNSELVVYNINQNEVVKKIILPLSTYKFLSRDHDLLNVYDTKHSIFYLIDPLSYIMSFREKIENVSTINWANNNILIYANDFELWLYDASSHNKTLLTRISDRIKNIIWHPNNKNIIFSTEKGINILDLDMRDNYLATGLIELDNMGGTYMNKSGNTIYYYSRIGNQEGIWMQKIQ